MRDTLPQLVENFIDTGKIKYVASDFPLPNHAQAFKAAVASHCAHEQQKFWDMAAKIFENFRTLSPETMKQFAGDLGLDQGKFDECLDSDKYDEQINTAKSEGSKAGVRATPTFLLGYTQEDGSTKFKAEESIVGAYPYDSFKQKIEALIASKDEKKPVAKKDGAAVE